MAATERHIRRRRSPLRRASASSATRCPGAVVDLRSVSKKYPSGDMGLEDATFAIHPGEFVFLVGATGSGKSTIMRLLIKEIEPSYGSIAVAGRDLSEITRKKIPYYRRNLGVVFQDFKLLPNRTVYDNVAYALQVTGGKRREVREKVPDILRLTGLSTKLHNYPDQLSGGEQQRVSVARAFVNHPPLLLADEPTGNLDPETSVGIMQLLYRINRTGTTVVVATHDKAMVDRMRRRVIEVSRGPRRARRAHRRLQRRRDDARVRRALAPGARVRFGFFLREALRALRRNAVPSFAAVATVLVTVLVLGVFIPVVQATTGAANEIRSQGARRRLPQERRERGRHQPRAARSSRTRRPASAASSSSPSRRRSAPSARPAAATTTTCSAPTRCPTCCASRRSARRTSCRCATRSRRCRRRASAP